MLHSAYQSQVGELTLMLFKYLKLKEGHLQWGRERKGNGCSGVILIRVLGMVIRTGDLK